MAKNVTKPPAKQETNLPVNSKQGKNNGKYGITMSEMFNMLLNLQDGQRKIIENQDRISSRLDSIENDMANLRDEVSILRKDQKEMADHIEDLQGCSDWHYDNIKILQFEQLHQKQYSRKASFRIFDVAENEGENVKDIAINVLKDEIDVDVKNEEIDIAHRVGGFRNDGKLRPILVKCVSHKSKAEVMRNKKKAKNVKIHEDLAHGIKSILDELVERKSELGLDSVWTVDGKIKYKFIGNERVHLINCHADYMRLTSVPRRR